jgi:ABC-type branched-subunit amino acid transport system ATPase component
MTPHQDIGLRVRRLAKSFGGVHVINGIDLDMGDNRRHLIIGPNGAGKTTFFNLLTGQLQPSEGSIEFSGRNITGAAVHTRARLGLSRTFQIASLFRELSVWENVLLAAKAPSVSQRSGIDAIERATKAIQDCGLTHRRLARVQTLSYGEQRRLEIALSLSTAPHMILLDEPMAGLTQDERKALAGRIRELSRTVSVVFIEHDLEIALTIAERLTVFHLGQVVADGEPDAVLSDPFVHQVYIG